MAGLRPQAYWLAQFVSEGVVIGGLSAFMIAIVAAPGLFSSAGHSEVPFFSLLGLHSIYLLALVSVGFVSAFWCPSTPKPLFALISQVAGVVCYFGGRVAGKVQRRRPPPQSGTTDHTKGGTAHPQFARMLLVEGFQSHRKKRCRVWGAYKGEAYISSDYAAARPKGNHSRRPRTLH